MRALRCALTARPRFGMTNLPAPPLHSFTASLKSSSKKADAVFFGVPTFSAKWATIFDLLIGFAAIDFNSPLWNSSCAGAPRARITFQHARHYKDTASARQAKSSKNPIKRRFFRVLRQKWQIHGACAVVEHRLRAWRAIFRLLFSCGFISWRKPHDRLAID